MLIVVCSFLLRKIYIQMCVGLCLCHVALVFTAVLAFIIVVEFGCGQFVLMLNYVVWS